MPNAQTMRSYRKNMFKSFHKSQRKTNLKIRLRARSMVILNANLYDNDGHNLGLIPTVLL